MQTDFNGDGVIDRVDQGPITDAYTFTAPGVYLANMQVTDMAGTYSMTVPIVVQDVKVLDKTVQATYNSMLERLKAGDIDGAMQFFTPDAAAIYRPVFDAVGAQLPQTAGLLGTIVDGYITNRFAEYLLVQNRPTGQRGFLMYILKGPDGLWRIGQM